MTIQPNQLKVPSELPSFKVYFKHNQSLIQLKFKDSHLRIEQLVIKCLQILSDTYMIKITTSYMHYALFPANKKGQKLLDSIQISHGQRIRSVGCKRFYLQRLNLSKISISTQINLQLKYGIQKKNSDSQWGCCMGFPLRRAKS